MHLPEHLLEWCSTVFLLLGAESFYALLKASEKYAKSCQS